MSTRAAIVIPIYKDHPSNMELSALIQCAGILKKYDLCFITHRLVNFSAYKIINKCRANYKFEYFDKDCFSSIQSYSKLCLNPDLYKRFETYDYMFLFQLDGWIFKDELEYWCNQNFDYIGAPWFEGYENANEKSRFITPSGNGGVFLRKIDKFIVCCSKLSKIQNMRYYNFEHFKTYYKGHYNQIRYYFAKSNSVKANISNANEDYIVVNFFNKLDKTFKVAPPEIALRFSFENLPARLYEMNDKLLPFSCHAWERYGKDFYKDFINKDINNEL